ncbi:hypothetical protein CEXT_714231 [Caerostris extrusa]|uniref:Uncharacterized protein n=1 Tax=Caerostris extrusa TaxID=172846 RepID=A0AAV4N353_CAEEX|nr:hypothetical protein CEXT_714231 [Caerostris extrusa]
MSQREREREREKVSENPSPRLALFLGAPDLRPRQPVSRGASSPLAGESLVSSASSSSLSLRNNHAKIRDRPGAPRVRRPRHNRYEYYSTSLFLTN